MGSLNLEIIYNRQQKLVNAEIYHVISPEPKKGLRKL